MAKNLSVVILAYNRPNALKRLLDSLLKAHIKEYNLNLVFSLDKNSHPQVVELANSFEIIDVKKEIIQQKESLGAEKHNLLVQQLSISYENLLILEDDSFVSPFIFDYAFSALKFYNQNDIAMISLYPYLWVESVSVPFSPVYDGYFNYFQQRPTSHGYIIQRYQVNKFNNWFKNFKTNKNQLPPNTLRWNKQSWERIWYNYLIETNQFTVFPRVAFNTVFGEIGYNVKNIDEENAFHQSLSIGKETFNFSTLENSMSVYDAFYEYLRYDAWGFKNLEGNIYGTKKKSTLKNEFVVINGFNKHSEQVFGRGLKPIELNILLNNPGKKISIIKKDLYKSPLINNIDNYLYFHSLFSIPNLKILVIYYLRKFKRLKIFKFLYNLN